MQNHSKRCQNHSAFGFPYTALGCSSVAVPKCEKFLQFTITSKQNKLESRGWSQIVAFKKSFPDLMYFLKIDVPEAKLCGLLPVQEELKFDYQELRPNHFHNCPYLLSQMQLVSCFSS